MQEDLIRVLLAFFEGFALIVSPCILPILPIMLSASLTGNKSRPLGIITGFVLTFTIFTLFSRIIISLLHISPDVLRNASFTILILLAIVMLSTYLTDKFNILTNRLLSVGSSLKSANDTHGGFLSGLLFGALVGIIWTPCAGPILAAVIVQVVLQKTSLTSALTVIAFGIGAGVPMLLIALLGRKVMNNFSFFRNHTALIRKLLGLIILASVIAMIYLPAASFSFGQTTTATPQNSLVNGVGIPYKAPEFAGISDWINSPPLTIEQLKGKVVLIDFWTYSCINCIRTLPYIKDWYAKYHTQGLEIIGVHSPEFQFEHDLQNVKDAVTKDGIKYPVALDNNFQTWQNYQNEYWPAHYLIDKKGEVVYTHFGEGDYDVTENNIRFLLGMNTPVTSSSEATIASDITPETYLGFARSENFASIETVNDNKAAVYTYPSDLEMNQWALRGSWIIYSDKIVSASPGAAIKLHFNARNVYAVMGAPKTIIASIRLNGEPLNANKGADVNNSQVNVSQNRLYTLISYEKENQGFLEITFNELGAEIYTFTFG